MPCCSAKLWILASSAARAASSSVLPGSCGLAAVLGSAAVRSAKSTVTGKRQFAALGKVKGRALVHAAQDGDDGRLFARQHLASLDQALGKVGGFGFFARRFFSGERVFAFFQFGLACGQRLFALGQFGFFGFKFGFVHRGVLRLRGAGVGSGSSKS